MTVDSFLIYVLITHNLAFTSYLHVLFKLASLVILALKKVEVSAKTCLLNSK